MENKLSEEVAILKENNRWQNKILEEIRGDVKEIKDSHSALKWKIVGASSMIAFLASLVVDFLRK